MKITPSFNTSLISMLDQVKNEMKAKAFQQSGRIIDDTSEIVDNVSQKISFDEFLNTTRVNINDF